MHIYIYIYGYMSYINCDIICYIYFPCICIYIYIYIAGAYEYKMSATQIVSGVYKVYGIYIYMTVRTSINRIIYATHARYHGSTSRII